MSGCYNQNYSIDAIKEYLNKIKICIEGENFSVAKGANRRENMQFFREYNLDEQKIRAILLKIEADDFCYSSSNTHIGFEHETLYIFSPKLCLIDSYGNDVMESLYVKFNLIERINSKQTIVISLHRLNRSISYCFKK